MTNPVAAKAFGAQQQNTYLQQYRKNPNSLKNKDIVYGEASKIKANSSLVDQYLAGYSLGEYNSTSGEFDQSLAFWDGNGASYSDQDHAAALGISTDLYNNIYAKQLDEGVADVGFETVAKYLDEKDGTLDGTLKLEFRQSEEARVVNEQREETFAAQAFSTIKDKTLSDLQAMEITYGEAPVIKADPLKVIDYIKGYLGEVSPKTPEAYAHAMGISTPLYNAIINRMPHNFKHPTDVMALLDASDKQKTGGLNGVLSVQNRKDLELELEVSGKVNSLFPSEFYIGKTEVDGDLLRRAITHSANATDGEVIGGNIQQRMADLQEVRNFQAMTNATVTVNTDEDLYTEGSGIYVTAGEGDTYAKYFDAMWATDSIGMEENGWTDSEVERFKRFLKESLVEYNEKNNGNTSGEIKEGDQFHIWSVVNNALNKMPDTPNMAQARKKWLAGKPGKKITTTTTRTPDKLWFAFLVAAGVLAWGDDV